MSHFERETNLNIKKVDFFYTDCRVYQEEHTNPNHKGHVSFTSKVLFFSRYAINSIIWRPLSLLPWKRGSGRKKPIHILLRRSFLTT